MSESKRQKQLASVLQRDLSTIFQRLGAHIYGTKTLVTITGVSVTPDLYTGRVYISIYNTSDKDKVLGAINENLTRIRSELAQLIRKQVRVIPIIEFFLDNSLDEVEYLDKVFTKIKEEDSALHTEKDTTN